MSNQPNVSPQGLLSKNEAAYGDPSLLGLPRKVRDEIWRLLLVQGHTSRALLYPNFKFYTTILLTCHQIYDEGQKVYHHENIWVMITGMSYIHNEPWFFRNVSADKNTSDEKNTTDDKNTSADNTTSADKTISDAENMPDADMPDADNMSDVDDMPDADNMPHLENTPDVDNMPHLENTPDVDNMPPVEKWPILKDKYATLIGTPALEVKELFSDQASTKGHIAFIYNAEILDGICVSLCKVAHEQEVKIEMSLNSHPLFERSILQDMLLKPFELVRGVNKAVVKGISNSERTALRSYMESPIETSHDFLDVLHESKIEGDEHCIAGRYLEAACCHTRTLRLCRELISIGLCARLMQGLGRHDAQIFTNHLDALFSNISLISSFTNLQLGNFEEAKLCGSEALSSPGIPDLCRFRAHYLRGMASVALGEDSLAGIDFFYAQDLLPDDAENLQQLYDVEQRLGYCITTELAPIEVIDLPHCENKWRGSPELKMRWGAELLACRLYQLR